MPKLLDANAIIRFLLGDIPDQANASANIIYSGAFTKEAVMAEVIYVLDGVYNYSRDEITDKLLALLNLIDIENKPVMIFALNLYKDHKIDFVDCLLIGYNNVDKVEVFSFDRKLNNLLAV